MAYESRILPGAILKGRYEILSALGQGGFGKVYQARQLATGQSVAVKVLCLDGFAVSSWDRQLARFHREMQLCAQLHHPNIVRLIDSGQMDDGGLYTVFEFVPGKTLAKVLAEEGALEPAEAGHLLGQILDALSCAHAEGVVHRDLKPSNIMVIATGARRNALVLDFGIGALTEASPVEGWTRLTPTNEALGSPGYAAPEQMRCQPPTPRSDIFSWGLVFLECLTGRRVFDGPLPVMLRQQLGGDPVPIPPALRAHPLGEILRRATDKSVETRSGDAAELLRALDACDLRGLSRRALGEAGSALPDAHAPARNIPEATRDAANGPTAQVSRRSGALEGGPASANGSGGDATVPRSAAARGGSTLPSAR